MSDDVPPFYAMLEVDTDADRDEITAQYRKLVKEYHPDQGGTDEEFKKLKSAKETLTSAVERRRYDRVGHKSYVEITRCSGWQESPTARHNSHARSDTSTSAHNRSDTEDTSHRDSDQTGTTSASEERSSNSRTTDDRTTGRQRDNNSTSSTGRHQERSQSQSTTSESRRSRSSTNRDHTRSDGSTGTYTSGQSATKDRTDTSSAWSHARTDEWASIPRLLVVLVFSVGLSAILTILDGESIVTAGIAVVVGSGVVYGRDLRIAQRSVSSRGPQLSAASAALMATVSGVSTLLLFTAFIGGSLNGGLLIGRFVGVFTLLLMIVPGVITYVVVGFLTRSTVIRSITGVGVCLLLYVLEFTPLRWWFPFSAIENEPASTISPWVAAGPPTGYTLGWAVNLTLALLLFVSVALGLFFLVVGFTDLLRNGSNPDLHTIGWELFAAIPIVGLTWWSLCGNTVWALYGLQPASLPAAVLVLTVCVWPTVVFGLYAVVARLWYN